MKLDLYLVIGAGGVVGKQIVEYLQKLNKTFLYISAKNIVRQTNHNIKKKLQTVFKKKKYKNKR